MRRFDRRDTLAALDPEVDFSEIYRQLFSLEFPWDMNQSLSFALFRTYAVPSIGGLLLETGEFTGNVQKRYEDTALILDAVVEHGFASEPGRSAIRRMNQMHGSYDISNDDMRYVLATFVVIPVRWLAEFGWRPMSDVEVRACVAYYRQLGAMMAIADIPIDFAGFEALLDHYETEQFSYTDASRAIADATLDLMATFPPNNRMPATVIRQFSYSLMDDNLLAALHYPRPAAAVRALSRGALRLRGRIERWMPVRTKPQFVRQMPSIRGYPDGYAVERLGTFPCGCPVPHAEAAPTA